ncbi:MAG: nicotinate phosphoribosyltransferase [Clostridia bacterium]|nr:nicotinate phosphoribosyltransferase [Clostridia bacterium]
MENKTMMTDLYELTMAQAYFDSGEKDKEVIFDAFFRREPLSAGYAVMAGLDNIIEYIKNLKFTEEDIAYLRSLNSFSEDFLNYLLTFKFTGDIYAIPDGTPVFRNEPLITVKGPIIEAQIIETAILSYLNASICYSTAARKVVEAAGDIKVMEFGARRAFGPDAAVEASKCSYLAGVAGTSNVLAGKKFNIPVMGTMAHSLVQQADSEYEAFLNFAKSYPNNCVLLIDTYDTLRTGVPNAIRVAKEYLIPNGYRLKGVRIDSGDLAYLSKEAKKMFDEAGMSDVQICLSNGLNPETIRGLIDQGAIVNSIGLGDNIVAPDHARVGVVYKNAAVIENGEIIPKIKISSDAIKTINPGLKKVYRFYDKDTNYAIADLIALHDEEISNDEYILIDPADETNRQKISNYWVRELHEKVFENGVCVYPEKTLDDSRAYCEKEMQTIYPEVRRIHNPHKHYVDLSEKLLNTKKEMIIKLKNNI